jgi:hypothetical protein
MTRARGSVILAVIGLAALLLAAIDPLEGFPLVLLGGTLVAVAARLTMSRWLRLLAWGLALSVVGCAAMLVLTALGGVGGSSRLPLAWGVTVVPYPVGALLLIAGSVLLIRQLLGRERHPPA